jgi:hypothetical protein
MSQFVASARRPENILDIALRRRLLFNAPTRAVHQMRRK